MKDDDALTRAEAEFHLALAYLNGDEVVQNFDLAVSILEKLSNRGYDKAKAFLESLETRERYIGYPSGLIHITARGEKVRSKSEVIISDALFSCKVEYSYERSIYLNNKGTLSPDFTIDCLDGNIILWEHLGLLSKIDYLKKWEKKEITYSDNGFIIGENLFVTRDGDDGSIDSQYIHSLASKIKIMTTLI